MSQQARKLKEWNMEQIRKHNSKEDRTEKFLRKGRERGEEITGATSKEVGEGRAEVRDRLKETLEGNSAAAAALQQDQAQQSRTLRANQAMAGGGQMNEGQQQALQRTQLIDRAQFVSGEKRQALSDISKEYRGAGGDIMRSEGQYGSIAVGAMKPAVAKQSKGLLSSVFGGIF